MVSVWALLVEGKAGGVSETNDLPFTDPRDQEEEQFVCCFRARSIVPPARHLAIADGPPDPKEANERP